MREKDKEEFQFTGSVQRGAIRPASKHAISLFGFNHRISRVLSLLIVFFLPAVMCVVADHLSPGVSGPVIYASAAIEGLVAVIFWLAFVRLRLRNFWGLSILLIALGMLNQLTQHIALTWYLGEPWFLMLGGIEFIVRMYLSSAMYGLAVILLARDSKNRPVGRWGVAKAQVG